MIAFIAQLLPPDSACPSPRASRVSFRLAGTLAVRLAVCLAILVPGSGCSLFPDIKHKPQYNNPFPQLRTIAVMPFVNQSEEPTLSGERVALAYIDELQSIPGFEVLPLGVVKARLQEYQPPLACGQDFQEFARVLGVDAVLLGSVTDYSPYYPPRMTIKVNWYAANPGFHPVLPGYGLPWGTKEEKKIPRWIHREAQRALAAEQLKTQTPLPVTSSSLPNEPTTSPTLQKHDAAPPPPVLMPEDQGEGDDLIQPVSVSELVARQNETEIVIGTSVLADSDSTSASGLPNDWPDPRGFIPAGPSVARRPLLPQHEPIISHMRNFNGHDEDFTQQLADYVDFRDDARFGGWQAYLRRSEDFIRVCCHFHVTETLAARGGQEESRLILRWPIERYAR